MVFEPSTAAHLKPWLVRTLEPICDAEPGALADYILALLKHNVPESDMRKELAVQLEEFLEKETTSFIDTLFTVLRTKSYLPYTSSTSLSTTANVSSVDTGIPIPLDAFMSPSSPSIPTSPGRGQKRTMDHDERDGRPPAKGPRLNSEGQFSRYSNGRGDLDSRSTGAWGGPGGRPGMNGQGDGLHMNMGMNGMGHMNGRSPQIYLPPDQKRGICRDYHNNGYCARGAFCKFSHGEDAVVPGPIFGMNGGPMPGAMPFLPMFPSSVPFGMAGVSGPGYDPHEARMDMRPHGPPGVGGGGRTPILPRVQQENGSQAIHHPNASGELPVIQDLTPKPPSEEVSVHAVTEDEHRSGIGEQPNRHVNATVDVEMGAPMDQSVYAQGGGRGRGGYRGGRGRGTFGGDVHNFRPERRNDKTLVVEKIPEDKLSLDAVNSWFKRFGTVTNVAIDAVNAKALVSFSNHDEAHAAWKSEDAVFNNRFVKLFWHRPLEGHGQVGARMLAASAPLVKTISAKEASPVASLPAAAESSTPVATTSVVPRKASTPSAASIALATKQRLLEQQIAEQKTLMSQLQTASADEKKQIMARLRKLGEEMKPPSSPSPALGSSASPAPAPQKGNTSTVSIDGREQRERERLDKELELHSASLAVNGEQEESTEDLKAKLDKLKAEAASLGLPEAGAGPSHSFERSSAYRPYRARGRITRSYYRGAGRGGPPRASMKLDNRPKKLVVKGVSSDGVQAVRDWYETTGAVDFLETGSNGDIIISFKTRSAAEQGFSKGHDIPTVGQVQVAWYTSHQPSSATHKAVLPASETLDAETDDKSVALEAHPLEQVRPHSPHMQEEEIVTSGWGGDGDGEDGMGML